MQLLVLQSLQRTARLLHPAHAVPTLGHSFLRAQRTDRFAPGALFFSFRVLFAFTSLVTVEGLTPASRAIFRAESPLRMPSSMITLLSLSMCFLLPSLIAVSLPAGASSSKRDARGKRGQDGCGIRPAPNFFCGRCTTWCNRIAFRNSIHDAHAEGIRRDDGRDIVPDKGLLCAGALVCLHAGVVGGSTEAVFEKRCCDLFGALPRPAVDDA